MRKILRPPKPHWRTQSGNACSMCNEPILHVVWVTEPGTIIGNVYGLPCGHLIEFMGKMPNDLTTDEIALAMLMLEVS